MAELSEHSITPLCGSPVRELICKKGRNDMSTGGSRVRTYSIDLPPVPDAKPPLPPPEESKKKKMFSPVVCTKRGRTGSVDAGVLRANGLGLHRNTERRESADSTLVRTKKKKKKGTRRKKKKNKQDSFPINIMTPSGDNLVVHCDNKATTEQFTVTCMEKLKGVKIKKDFVLFLENGLLLPQHEVLFQMDCISESLAEEKTPVLYLSSPISIGLSQRESSKSRSMAKAVVGKDTFASLTLDFDINFILPGGINMTIKICTEAIVTRNALLLHYKSYDLHVYPFKPDQKGFENEQEIGMVWYIKNCRLLSSLPKVAVIPRRHDPFTPQEKKNIVQVTRLVGRLEVPSDPVEELNFKEKMARLRYLERKLVNPKKTKNLRCSINLAERSAIQPKKAKATFILISVYFPLAGLKKTRRVNLTEMADATIKIMFDKHYATHNPDKQASDFIFKVIGIREFICGPHPFSSFQYVQKKVEEKAILKLAMCEPESKNEEAQIIHDDPLLEETFDAEWTLGGNEILQACAIQYNHDDIYSDSMAPENKTHISLWELSQPLRVRLVSITNLSNYCQSFSKIDTNSYLYVTAGLYYGGELLSESMQNSARVPVSFTPSFGFWFKFPIKMSDIPRETRICFTLYGSKGKTTPPVRRSSIATSSVPKSPRDELRNDTPIAWVNCLLFHFNHELRTGPITLRMWKDKKANPIGTCVQNFDILGPLLNLHFDEYKLPVVFPTNSQSSLPEIDSNINLLIDEYDQKRDFAEIDKIVRTDPLYTLSDKQKGLLWTNREYCSAHPKSLPKLLASVPWDSRVNTAEIHRMLKIWKTLHPLDALEMLDSRFPDAKVRAFVVRCLDDFADDDLQTYLLQLIQVLKYEPYHDSALARFLMRRALRSKRIGHVFFWNLKGEIHCPEIAERYGLLLEAYLYGCNTYLDELYKQNEILLQLQQVADAVKIGSSADRKEILMAKLEAIELPDRFQLPIDPTWEAKAFVVEKCKYMDSKKLPLWLEMTNADPSGKPLVVIFKSGDDLRQDMLTLQIIRVMDKLWKQEGLDLELSPYGCISTGNEVGMIEVVQNSSTTAAITREAGGAKAAFKKSPLANWLAEHNRGPNYDIAVNRFMHSCAGYCVATYVLGIGDRHNDNIMVQKNGRLFHIDFGHFLGNFKKKFGYRRERAKFVFTPDFAYVMGGVGSDIFAKFVTLCCDAYNILRKHAGQFINLFSMMLSTGIPELRQARDIDYLRDALRIELEDEEAAASFTKELSSSLGCRTTMINNMIHILAH